MHRLDLKKLSPEVYALLLEVGAVGDELGVPVFVVGGVVRDLVLGRRSLDVDVVVEGDAIKLAQVLAARWKRLEVSLTAHRKFGTAALERNDGIKLDVVTARRETYARPGVLPDVVPGLIADDLFRRDFTINAVAVALNKGDFGVVHDDFDGLDDIKNKLIRIMHYRSFIDDPTRILRAVRYEKRFGFKFESRTLAVLKQALEENVFSFITPARYFGEFKRVLQEEDPRAAMRRLSSLSGLRFFIYNTATESSFREILSQEMSRQEQWIALLAVLMTSLDKASSEELLVSFNMPRVDKNKVLKRLL